MELQTLKQFFFKGEEEAVNSFCEALKPRCIQRSQMREVNGVPTLLLEYVVDGVTSFIDSYMNTYRLCPVCGKLEPADGFKEVPICMDQRIKRNPNDRYKVKRELVCASCIEAQTFVVPERGTSDWLYVDNDWTRKVVYADDHVEWFAHENTRPSATVFKDAYTITENGTLKLVEKAVYQVILLSKVMVDVYGNYVYILTEDVETHLDLFGQCSECGSTVLKSVMSEDGKCPRCSRVEIYGYHSWPGQLEFKKLDSEGDVKMFFGVEIETEGGQRNSRLVGTYQDIWHLEEDGSLDDGFEMISQPMSWEFIKAEMPRFREMFKALSDAGQISHEGTTCGFHIHVSRDAFDGDRAIKRCLAIVHGLSGGMCTIGRRSSSRYASFYSIPANPWVSDILNFPHTGHGVAENCGYHSDHGTNTTIEFRFPRGTLNPDTFLATIEFIKTVDELANSNQNIVKFGDLLYGDYVPAYVETRKNVYHNYFDLNESVSFTRFTLENGFNELCDNVDSEEALQRFIASVSEATGRRVVVLEGGAA